MAMAGASVVHPPAAAEVEYLSGCLPAAGEASSIITPRHPDCAK
ncbi:hypothetical protein MMMB2_1468 [Mycobacterium marinum MB2]|nr:hypothetical protein MMMB2_1468 [Mycobacterium marinum MB2]